MITSTANTQLQKIKMIQRRYLRLYCPSDLQRWCWTIETWISCKQIDHKQFSLQNYRKCEMNEIRESQIWLNFLRRAHAMVIKQRDIWQSCYKRRHLGTKIFEVRTISVRNMWSGKHYPYLKCCGLHHRWSPLDCGLIVCAGCYVTGSVHQSINKLELLKGEPIKDFQRFDRLVPYKIAQYIICMFMIKH